MWPRYAAAHGDPHTLLNYTQEIRTEMHGGFTSAERVVQVEAAVTRQVRRTWWSFYTHRNVHTGISNGNSWRLRRDETARITGVLFVFLRGLFIADNDLRWLHRVRTTFLR